jgi:hypothetical protein
MFQKERKEAKINKRNPPQPPGRLSRSPAGAAPSPQPIAARPTWPTRRRRAPPPNPSRCAPSRRCRPSWDPPVSAPVAPVHLPLPHDAPLSLPPLPRRPLFFPGPGLRVVRLWHGGPARSPPGSAPLCPRRPQPFPHARRPAWHARPSPPRAACLPQFGPARLRRPAFGTGAAPAWACCPGPARARGLGAAPVSFPSQPLLPHVPGVRPRLGCPAWWPGAAPTRRPDGQPVVRAARRLSQRAGAASARQCGRATPAWRRCAVRPGAPSRGPATASPVGSPRVCIVAEPPPPLCAAWPVCSRLTQEWPRHNSRRPRSTSTAARALARRAGPVRG